MIQSMTGYGKAELLTADHKTIVEFRSVNSKQLDLTLKLASLFRDKEPEIRALIQTPLERGKVDVAIYTQQIQAEGSGIRALPIDWQNVRTLRDTYRSEMGLEPGDQLMASFIKMSITPEAETTPTLSDEEWNALRATIAQALDQYLAFRIQEGKSLENMFTEKLNAIETLLAEVEPYETNRVANIRARLMGNLDELSKREKVEVDKNRLEAEMIYYLEKLDITEEKVRLKNHIRYFRETMAAEGQGVGKKLGFIAQEMGREINTLGSKSNQSEMQILVVKMKDLLEQIKEQVLNVL